MKKILTSLTNRADFNWPGYQITGEFKPAKLKEDTISVSNDLGLAIREDYFTHGVLQAMCSLPHVLCRLGNEPGLERIPLYKPPRNQIATPGFSLIPSAKGGCWIRRKPEAWPTSLLMTVKALSTSSAMVTLAEEGKSEIVACVKDAKNRLQILWPSWSGVVGLVSCSGAWDPGDQFEISHTPVNYPYSIVASFLKEKRYVNSLLLRHGLAGPFHVSYSPIEKVAFVGLAVTLDHPQFS